MGEKIKYINVISDNGGMYSGRVKVSDLINDYVSGLSEVDDAYCIKWLNDKSFDVEPKLVFIASVWGIDYEIVK